MTQPNAELAYRVLDHIDAHPEQWDQGNWWRRTGCGTRGCFAGWTLALSGMEMPDAEYVNRGSHRFAVDGKRLDIRTAASRLLGINEDGFHVRDEYGDWADLFDGDNDREHLGAIVEQLFGPRTDGDRVTVGAP